MPSDPLQVRLRLARASEKGFVLDVEFDVPPGITILFGPSGSGKSTVVGAVAGLVRPDAGRIALGKDVWFDSAVGVERPVHLRGIALVFQSLALFPHMTALQNVEYGVDRALSQSIRTRRAMEMLDRMKVVQLVNRRPSTFSGGEAQRVALARAFARSPKVVLLDEPFSALDRELRQELCADVRDTIAELELPTLMVTHRRNEARALGERILVMEAGQIRAAGRIGDHLTELGPAFEYESPMVSAPRSRRDA